MRDDGNATVEFVALAVVLMVPLVHVLLAVFAVQRAAFAVSQAAREAGRAYAVTTDADAARDAADLALADQLPGAPEAAMTLDVRDREVTVTVTHEVAVLTGLARIPVTATHVATVDRYR